MWQLTRICGAGLRSAALLALATAACGGSGAGSSSRSADSARDDDGWGESSAGDATGGDDDSSESQSAAISCDDGTCFECGNGICPNGFYCDEGAVGGPACSWLPSCAAEPSCGCVKKALGRGCSCEERGTGLVVSCP